MQTTISGVRRTHATSWSIQDKKIRFDVSSDVVVVTILDELGGPDAQMIVSLDDLKQLVKGL